MRYFYQLYHRPTGLYFNGRCGWQHPDQLGETGKLYSRKPEKIKKIWFEGKQIEVKETDWEIHDYQLARVG